MKKTLVLLVVVMSVCFMGCNNLAFTKRQRSKIAVVLLEDAYENGGAEYVSELIDKLVIKGKLTEEQGAFVKEALQEAYDDLVERIKERGETKEIIDEEIENVVDEIINEKDI